MNIFENLLARIEKLETNAKTKIASIAYAEITSSNPLRIKYDGQSTTEAAIPGTIVRPPLGSRVLVLRLLTAAFVLGVAGGEDPEKIVINGVAYDREGSYATSLPTAWSTSGTWYYARDLTLPAPYTPPAGYGFKLDIIEDPAAITHLAQSTYSGTSLKFDLAQLANSTVRTVTRISWTLKRI